MKNYWDSLDLSLEHLMRNGYCYLPSVKEYVDLEELSDQVLGEITENVYSSDLKSHLNFCNEFGINGILASKLYELAKKHFNFKGLVNDQYHIARKVNPGLKSEAYRGHFDSHCFTLVFPVKIPKKITNESVGDLIFCPNAREMPSNEAINFFQKAYFKRYASENGFKSLSKTKKVLYEDFSNYKPLLFVGMKTYHANLAVNQILKNERLTLLSHFFDPSPSWGIGNILRTIRNR